MYTHLLSQWRRYALLILKTQLKTNKVSQLTVTSDWFILNLLWNPLLSFTIESALFWANLIYQFAAHVHRRVKYFYRKLDFQKKRFTNTKTDFRETGFLNMLFENQVFKLFFTCYSLDTFNIWLPRPRNINLCCKNN